jgi:SSS family solute:Na+ symporter
MPLPLAATSLGSIPYFVLGAYLAMLLGLGIVSLIKSRGASDAESDYYLAGRGQGALVTSLTIMATYFSGFAILTFPGWMYSNGIAPMLYALNLPVAAGAIFVLGNRIRRIGRKRGFVTPADMIAGYYGDSAAIRCLVALVGALYVIPYIVIQIKAGGLLAEGLFRDVESLQMFGHQIAIYDAGVAALSLVTMLYVLIGGMRSVAWTDVLQGTLLLSAMLLSGVTVCLFPPLSGLLLGEDHGINLLTTHLKGLLDTGFCGIVVNVGVFMIVSRFTSKLPPDHVAAFASDLCATESSDDDSKNAPGL